MGITCDVAGLGRDVKPLTMTTNEQLKAALDRAELAELRLEKARASCKRMRETLDQVRQKLHQAQRSKDYAWKALHEDDKQKRIVELNAEISQLYNANIEMNLKIAEMQFLKNTFASLTRPPGCDETIP
jgi:chaperonin cofactor prefoldin